MKYRDFVPRLASEFEFELGKIASVYNFELGDEFELALCQVFRRILPERYGICRGHVTTEDGQQAGDDIIIFDRLRYPTILSRSRDDFARMEWVPIEAVYAYIEAKHSLQIEGDGPSSLAHAVEQAIRVKQLVGTRQVVSISRVRPYFDFPLKGFLDFNPPRGYPGHLNPSFAAVFSRQVRKGPKGPVLHDREEIASLLRSQSVPQAGYADLIVAGKDHIALPTLETSTAPPHYHMAAPFYLPGVNHVAVSSSEGLAFGIGLCVLMWAFDWFQLGEMPWGRLVGDGLGVPTPLDP